MELSITGLDEAIEKLDSICDTISSLDGSTIPFDDLFTSSFMIEHTSVSTFDEFLEKGNFKVETQEDFDSIPNDLFDEYVSSSTDFNSWNDMLSAATDIYLSNLF